MTNETTTINTNTTFVYNINEDIEEEIAARWDDDVADFYAKQEVKAEAPFSDRALDGIPADLDFDDLVS